MNDASSSDLQWQLTQLSARIERIEQAFRSQGMSLGPEPAASSVVPPSVSGAAAAPSTATAPTRSPRPASTTENFAAAAAAVSAGSKDGTLENRVGAQLFNRIGIVALLVGMAWFLKFSFENHWIGPVGRILIGLLAGSGLIVWSERFRARGSVKFSYSLKAVGTGVLYLALWAAFDMYHLIPAWAAFIAMALVTAWNGYMCWVQNSELLALYALIGGFITPILVSTGVNHQLTLFSYLFVLDCAVFALVARRPWPRLILATFIGTAILLAGWADTFYTDAAFVQTAIYIGIFFLLFAVVPQRLQAPSEAVEHDLKKANWDRIVMAVLPLATALLGFTSFYTMLGEGGRAWARPWMTVAFSAVYLLLLQYQSPDEGGERSKTLNALYLAIAVIFLTITIPLAADGYWIAAGWLIEGAALMWVARRTERLLLRVLAIGALFLGVVALLDDPGSASDRLIFNARFGTYCIAIAAFAVVAWLAYAGAQAAIRPAKSDADGMARSFSLVDWRIIAGVSVICVNMLTLIGVAFEIHGYWVQRQSTWVYEQFSYSIWFMLFGGILLAIGFWKRMAFIRWQALILLAVSIGKAFLFDMSELSQGYRILSFLGLGALLLGISYAYQRDLLGLRPTKISSDAVKQGDE